MDRSPDVDAAGMAERMDAMRLKAILGEPLSERERMCLQMEEFGFGKDVPRQRPPRDGG